MAKKKKTSNYSNQQKKVQKLTELLNNAINAVGEETVISTLSDNRYGREFNSISAIQNVIKNNGENLKPGHIGSIENTLKKLAPKETKGNKYAEHSKAKEALTTAEPFAEINIDNQIDEKFAFES